jgi:hypothetical protein
MCRVLCELRAQDEDLIQTEADFFHCKMRATAEETGKDSNMTIDHDSLCL